MGDQTNALVVDNSYWPDGRRHSSPRILKNFFHRFDTGRVVGGINEIKRIYMSFAEPDIFIFAFYVVWCLALIPAIFLPISMIVDALKK